MLRLQITRVVVIATALMSAGVLVAAKGVTRSLTVTGPSINSSIEITDAPALANVWGGEFIGDPTDAPTASLPRYTVHFHVQPPRKSVTKVMYTVQYVRDERGGYVYLPGRGEHGYRMNIGTIDRPEHDGRWHRASEPWSRAINAHLP